MSNISLLVSKIVIKKESSSQGFLSPGHLDFSSSGLDSLILPPPPREIYWLGSQAISISEWGTALDSTPVKAGISIDLDTPR